MSVPCIEAWDIVCHEREVAKNFRSVFGYFYNDYKNDEAIF